MRAGLDEEWYKFYKYRYGFEIMTPQDVSTRVVIANATPFYRDEDGVWLTSGEWKSLNQWWSFIDNPVLFKPELIAEHVPDGWLKVPSKIEAIQLCRYDDHRLARRRDTLQVARKHLRPTDLLMARMPNYEASWCYEVARRMSVPLVLEIHGDWETSILEEDARSLFYRATRRIRAELGRRKVSNMAACATCVVSIGPQLIEKHVPDNVPSLVSTNHLLGESDYLARKDFTLKSPPRILFVGDMQRRKGLLFLFEALEVLKEQGQSFEITMIGSGPMITELEAYASAKGFLDSVEFTGQLAHGDQLYNYFRDSDVVVLPSVAAEGVPRVTHEAMALGCPVIATDIGSVAWQLKGGAGLVISPGDVKSLVDALTKIFSDTGLRQALSEKGFQRALDFTLETQRAKIKTFINDNCHI